MAKSIIWSDQSLQDIEAIAEFISKDSPYHAQRVIEEIINLVDLISQQANFGRVVPELNQSDIREQFIYSYRIIYQVYENKVDILSIIHGKRLLESL